MDPRNASHIEENAEEKSPRLPKRVPDLGGRAYMWIRTDTAFFNLGQCSSIEIAARPGTEKKTVYMLVATSATGVHTIVEKEAEEGDADSARLELNKVMDSVVISMRDGNRCFILSSQQVAPLPQGWAQSKEALDFLANR